MFNSDFKASRIFTLCLCYLLCTALLSACSSAETSTTFQEGVEVSNYYEHGLTGEYFNNAAFEGAPVTRIDTTIDFAWNGQAPIEGVDPSAHSVRWQGQAQPDVAGSYSFRVVTTGQARLLVNGTLAAQSGWDSSGEQFTQPIPLEMGVRYDLTLEYKHSGGGDSVIQLEWKRDDEAFSVTPDTNLFAEGSNLDAALFSLQTDPRFPFADAQLNAEYATGVRVPGGFTLLAQQPNTATFYMATLAGDATGLVQTLYKLAINSQSNAVLSDLKVGRDVALGDLANFMDSNGNRTPAQQATLETLVSELFGGTSTFGRVENQSLSVQQNNPYDIPSCEVCNDAAELLENAHKAQATNIVSTTAGIYTGVIGYIGGTVGKVVGGFVSATSGAGVSGFGLFGLFTGAGDIEKYETNYLECISGGKVDEATGELIPGCPPGIEVTHTEAEAGLSIEVTLNVGDEKIIGTTVTNTGAYSRLSYDFLRTGDAFWSIQRDNLVTRNFLDPGESDTIAHTLICYDIGTFGGRVDFFHRVPGVDSPITVSITLTCVDPDGVPDISEVEPNPIELEAGLNQTANSYLAFGNIGRANLEYSVVEGAGWLEVANSSTSGVAPPGGWVYLELTATCPATSGELNTTLTVQSNDPDTPVRSVSVELKCIAPEVDGLSFSVTSGTLEAKYNAYPGPTIEGTATFSNTGSDPLEYTLYGGLRGTNLPFLYDGITIDPVGATGSLEPGESTSINYTVHCPPHGRVFMYEEYVEGEDLVSTEAGEFLGHLVLRTNDSDEPESNTDVNLVCTVPPPPKLKEDWKIYEDIRPDVGRRDIAGLNFNPYVSEAKNRENGDWARISCDESVDGAVIEESFEQSVYEDVGPTYYRNYGISIKGTISRGRSYTFAGESFTFRRGSYPGVQSFYDEMSSLWDTYAAGCFQRSPYPK